MKKKIFAIFLNGIISCFQLWADGPECSVICFQKWRCLVIGDRNSGFTKILKFVFSDSLREVSGQKLLTTYWYFILAFGKNKRV